MPNPRTDWLDNLRDSLRRAETGLELPRQRGEFLQARVALCRRPRITVLVTRLAWDENDRGTMFDIDVFSTVTAELLTTITVERDQCRMVSPHDPCRGSWRIHSVNSTLAPGRAAITDPWHPEEAYGL
jgi:hypothetical protein